MARPRPASLKTRPGNADDGGAAPDSASSVAGVGATLLTSSAASSSERSRPSRTALGARHLPGKAIRARKASRRPRRSERILIAAGPDGREGACVSERNRRGNRMRASRGTSTDNHSASFGLRLRLGWGQWSWAKTSLLGASRSTKIAVVAATAAVATSYANGYTGRGGDDHG